jgi:hypothetical protein
VTPPSLDPRNVTREATQAPPSTWATSSTPGVRGSARRWVRGDVAMAFGPTGCHAAASDRVAAANAIRPATPQAAARAPDRRGAGVLTAHSAACGGGSFMIARAANSIGDAGEHARPCVAFECPSLRHHVAERRRTGRVAVIWCASLVMGPQPIEGPRPGDASRVDASGSAMPNAIFVDPPGRSSTRCTVQVGCVKVEDKGANPTPKRQTG